MARNNKLNQNIIFLVGLAICLAGSAQLAQAGQGCPFDNASCQDYCNQQGCRNGYCGHFAWIQCICRKCGDEWGYYDKVHYNPNKQVNQTELESLNLNASEPMILTNDNGQQQQKQRHATLTTLLIPDLSDGSKLDLNDIPDENSEKFLDFLAKNHEKLVEATSSSAVGGGQRAAAAQVIALDLSEEPAQATTNGRTTTTTTTTMPSVGDNGELQQQKQQQPQEETVEIQISSNNNNSNGDDSTNDETTTSSTTTTSEGPQRNRRVGSQVSRLLRMAVAEKSSEEIERKKR